MKIIYSNEVSFLEWQAVKKIGALNYNLEVWEFQNFQTKQPAAAIFSKGRSRFFDREDYTPVLQKFLKIKGYDFLFREAYQ